MFHCYLQPDVEVQARLFDMISDSFVTLLHSMEGSHKDEVFMVSVCVSVCGSVSV